MRLTRPGQLLLAVTLATACASQGGTSRELVAARAAYARAAAGPAATEAPRVLADARRSLLAAERENRDDPRSDDERYLAYVAKQRAELAMAKAETRRMERAAQLARVQLQRNASEAARAAELAKAEAEAATQRLQQVAEQRRAAERKLSTMRTALARFEVQLKHTRQLLAQKGNQVDERSRQLKEREAELQAQIDQLRSEVETAHQEVQQATEQRMVTERDLGTMRADLARLEVELEHTREQLAEKGDLLDEQTQQLKDREVALRAQIDQLRATSDRAEQLKQERDQALATLRDFATVQDDERGVVITVPSEVMFRTGSTKLLPRAREKLDGVAEALGKLGPEPSFVIEGHTDSRGSAEFNRELSKKRAEAVRAYLIDQGVDGDRIIARGRGEALPVAANTSVEGRASNRRVEIVVKPEGTTQQL